MYLYKNVILRYSEGSFPLKTKRRSFRVPQDDDSPQPVDPSQKQSSHQSPKRVLLHFAFQSLLDRIRVQAVADDGKGFPRGLSRLRQLGFSLCGIQVKRRVTMTPAPGHFLD